MKENVCEQADQNNIWMLKGITANEPEYGGVSTETTEYVCC